jgi:hypothetical protein
MTRDVTEPRNVQRWLLLLAPELQQRHQSSWLQQMPYDLHIAAGRRVPIYQTWMPNISIHSVYQGHHRPCRVTGPTHRPLALSSRSLDRHQGRTAAGAVLSVRPRSGSCWTTPSGLKVFAVAPRSANLCAKRTGTNTDQGNRPIFNSEAAYFALCSYHII